MNSPLYRCSYSGCSRAYKSRFSLNRHVKQHEGRKMHSCMYCYKSFFLAQYLREHIHIHTGERPYVCRYPNCGRTFRQSGKYSLHKKMHESDSKEILRVPAKDDMKSLINAMEAFYMEIKSFPFPRCFQTRELPPPESMQADM
eukprot:TRINITY_DN7839_c0_g1_i13.p1 TRINITY_DN7839_c0_g1~~TRINITY_DN7839_c0_g1_i13.p1  ORF type:complete len:143 (+),score=7.91 TRINITY_DN7839_c0_g1_i13:264-692(+)